MHPDHAEVIVGLANFGVTWRCSCGAHGKGHKLVSIPPGQPTIARLMADELNAHRQTYVGEQR